MKPGRRPLDLQARFWARVDKSGECWEWTGGKSQNGYGMFHPTYGRTIVSHRFAYQSLVGDLDRAELLDHRCRNRACVRPAHLRKVTAAQNSEHQDGHRDSKSGYRGVSWHGQSGKWQVKVTKNGKTHSGGLFTTPEEAAEAARQLRLSLFTHNDLDRKAS